jgi:hypothetical protein
LRSFSEFPHLPNLRILSLRLTHLHSSSSRAELVLLSPKLAFIDYDRSNIENVIYKLPLEKPEKLIKCVEGYLDPNQPTEWESIFNQLHSQRKAKKKGLVREKNNNNNEQSDEEKKEPIITDPALLTTDYPEL